MASNSFTSSLSLLLLFFLFTSSKADNAAIPSGTIQREIKQQILASIPPNSAENTVPFLTSPSGKYIGYLLRRETALGAGGMGNDFCYVQVQDTEASGGVPVWETECEPVSSANACSLVLCDRGLALFDGSTSVWDTGANNNNNFPATLELVDLGDMRVIDKDGELVWKATDSPRINQRCGLPGSPGLAADAPPFVTPIGGGRNPPFGQRTAYASGGALPAEAAVPPVTSPVGGGDNSGALPVPTAAPPVAAPVGGEDNSEALPVPTAAPSVAAPVSGEDNGEALPVPTAAAPVGLPSGLPLSAASPPFAGEQGATPPYPAGGAFGQPQQQQQQVQGLNGVHQPLLDNNPYDSGSSRTDSWIGVVFIVIVSQLVANGL